MILVGITVPSRPGRSNDQRAFGPRSRVGQPGFSKERDAGWKATPELVSQDRERVSLGPSGFQGTRLRTPADPSLGAVGAGSNAGPHFFSGKPLRWLPSKELAAVAASVRLGVRPPERCGLCPIGAGATHSFIEAVLRRRLSAMGRRKPSADCRIAERAALPFDERADTNVAKRVRAGRWHRHSCRRSGGARRSVT